MARDLAVGPRRTAGDYHADLNRISSPGRGRPDRFHPGPTSLAGPAWTLLHGGELQLKLQLWRFSCRRWVMSRTTQVYDVSRVLSHAIWRGRLSCLCPMELAMSPAFRSISPGLVHKCVHTIGAASGHLPGRHSPRLEDRWCDFWHSQRRR